MKEDRCNEHLDTLFELTLSLLGDSSHFRLLTALDLAMVLLNLSAFLQVIGRAQCVASGVCERILLTFTRRSRKLLRADR